MVADRVEAISTWGEPFGAGNSQAVTVQSSTVHRGRRAVAIELGKCTQEESRTFQMFVSGFAVDPAYRQTRDLGRFEALEFAIRNQTGIPLRTAVEVRDFRDSDDHRALWSFTLDGQQEWRQVSVRLAANAAGWQRIGQPDFGRLSSLRFVIRPERLPAEGSVCLDDVVLVEPGGPLPVEQTPLQVLVERIARRGWDGLWAARSREHGMIPSHSYQVTDAGLNTTAALRWMLPAAVRRGWVDRDLSDAYVSQLTRTLDLLIGRARYLPPRHVDWVRLRPFVAYQRQVMCGLRDRGRPWLVQPDAGDDGTLANYQQFSLYENFGQADLFMPWSVAFALLAGVEGSEQAFRFLLEHGLHGLGEWRIPLAGQLATTSLTR